MVFLFVSRTRVPGAIAASLIVVGAVSLSGALHQQQPPFRTSVELVELDVIATDREGCPISDLLADDLEVLEDGHPVEVASFRAVQLSAAPAPATPALAPGPGIAWASNDGPRDGRVVVIVLDRVDRTRFYRVRQTVLAILKQMGEENVVPELREFLTAPLRANIAVYAFNPRHAFDVDGMVHAESVEDRASQLQSEREGTRGLQAIAEATGGRATARTNAFEADVKRMFSESASY